MINNKKNNLFDNSNNLLYKFLNSNLKNPLFDNLLNKSVMLKKNMIKLYFIIRERLYWKWILIEMMIQH